MPVEFCLAQKKDIDELVFIENSAFDARKYPLMSKANFAHILDKSNSFIIIAKSNKKICAMSVIFLRKNSHYGRMYSIAVLPEYQGKDIGKKLFEKVIEELKRRKLKGIVLEIREDNIRHKERYIKLGFKITALLKDYYPDACGGLKLKMTF